MVRVSKRGGDRAPYEPALAIFNSFLLIADLWIRWPSHLPDVDYDKSLRRRRVGLLAIQLAALAGVLLSFNWFLDEPKEEEIYTLAAAIFTAFYLIFPDKDLLSQILEHRQDDSARKNVLTSILEDVKRLGTPDLIPNVKLPISFSLRPELIHPPTPIAPTELSESIVNVYDTSKGLLILGKAGTGKTTLGLEIINALARRAKRDLSGNPIPIWLRDLSTWQAGQTFDEWIVSALRREYGVPDNVGENWINVSGDLVLVLDGLEEIRDIEIRRKFIDAVNEYAQRRRSRTISIVILSRTDEYKDTNTKLGFTTAVEVNLLTKEEILSALEAGGSDLDYVRRVLESDPELFELAQRPLWLGLIASIYAGDDPEVPPPPAHGQIRRRILEQFLRQRFNSARDMNKTEVDRAYRWLRFIAAKLQEQSNRLILFVDELDESWLQNFPQRAIYKLVTSLFAILLGILMAGITCIIDFRGDVMDVRDSLLGFQSNGTYFILFHYVILAIVYSYIILVIVWRPAQPQKWRTIAFRHGVVLTALTAALAFATSLSINLNFQSEFLQTLVGTYLGLPNVALTGALMIGLAARAEHTIGRFKWSGSSAGSGCMPGLMAVLFLSLILGCSLGFSFLAWYGMEENRESLARELTDPKSEINQELNRQYPEFANQEPLSEEQLKSVLPIIIVLVSVLIVIFVIPFSFLFYAGYIVPTSVLLSIQEGRKVASRSDPAHALKNWSYNAFYAFLLVGLGATFILFAYYTVLFFPFILLSIKLEQPQSSEIFAPLVNFALEGLKFGLPFGVAASLTFGGKMLIKNYVARTILSVGGMLPRDVIRFLNRMTSLTIMSSSSGGYTFYHPIVRNHFTDKYESN